LTKFPFIFKNVCFFSSNYFQSKTYVGHEMNRRITHERRMGRFSTWKEEKENENEKL